jgi:8-oxo-dGTP pyrophosphatase MutT (NUDIX family)
VLEPCQDLSLARRLLEEYAAPDDTQAEARDRILEFIARHPEDAHLRSCLPGHLTASALLLDHSGERALLTFHRKLGRWLQLGGHCDGDANLAGVALRECQEESGIEELVLASGVVDVDIHEIPARPGEPAHLHLDTRFLVRAADGAVETRNHESLELRWFAPEELGEIEADETLRRLFRLAWPGAWA